MSNVLCGVVGIDLFFHIKSFFLGGRRILEDLSGVNDHIEGEGERSLLKKWKLCEGVLEVRVAVVITLMMKVVVLEFY